MGIRKQVTHGGLYTGYLARIQVDGIRRSKYFSCDRYGARAALLLARRWEREFWANWEKNQGRNGR